MNWDILLLLRYIHDYGKLDTGVICDLLPGLEDLLSTKVYGDLKNMGSSYTDKMYDRLVMDVYIRLYHQCYKNSTQMFLLILLLTLRSNTSSGDMFTRNIHAYMIRLNTLKPTVHNNTLDYLLSDVSQTHTFFKTYAVYIESFDLDRVKWNDIANPTLQSFAFTVAKLLYDRNSNILNEQLNNYND